MSLYLSPFFVVLLVVEYSVSVDTLICECVYVLFFKNFVLNVIYKENCVTG